MTLSNVQRADLLRHAFKSTPMIPNGLYHFRLTVFEVLEGSSIDPDDFANRFAPPGKPMGSGHWEMLPIVCDYMELAKEPELRIIEMLKLVNAI